MKQSHLFSRGIWPFLIVPSLLLAILLFFEQHLIEEDVANNAKLSLQAIEANWAQVETYNRGRDVLLTGTAPSQQSVDEALAMVQSAKGVRIAEFAGVIVDDLPPNQNSGSPKLTSIVNGDSIILRGRLASLEEIMSIVADAERSFGGNKVVNKIMVDKGLTPLPNYPSLFKALKDKAIGLGTLSADIENDTLSLIGLLPDQSIKDSLISEIKEFFDGRIIDKLAVAEPIDATTCRDLINELLSYKNITFETASAVIDISSQPLLDKLALTARRCPETTFEVAGHTDATGSNQFNLKLSQQRAAAVVQMMLDRGLSAEQFTAKGYGASQAIADNVSEKGRARNRRIEFKIQD